MSMTFVLLALYGAGVITQDYLYYEKPSTYEFLLMMFERHTIFSVLFAFSIVFIFSDKIKAYIKKRYFDKE